MSNVREGGTHSATEGITIETLTRVDDHIRSETYYMNLGDARYRHLIEHRNFVAPDIDGQKKTFHIVEVLSTTLP